MIIRKFLQFGDFYSLLLLCLLVSTLFAFSMPFSERRRLRERVRSLFYHGFDNYMLHAWPRDILLPLTCSGRDSLGGYSLTLIDSFDMLALLGDYPRFLDAAENITSYVSFDRNVSVSVFETNIRVLGGLLSSYFILRDRFVPNHNSTFGILHNDFLQREQHRIEHTTSRILDLTIELGDMLLEAFTSSPTGLPFGAVNLRYGVAEDELLVTSTASCGTYLIEFGLLTALTGDDAYLAAARKAALHLYKSRDPNTKLIGNHINIETSLWPHKDFGIGAGVDSYFEYLWKSYVLFGTDEYLKLFRIFEKKIYSNIHVSPFYLEILNSNRHPSWISYNSLQGFWPAVQATAGEILSSRHTLEAFFSVWKLFGATPEGFGLATQWALKGQLGYPLRPEVAESLYFLYRATHDPKLLLLGKEMIRGLTWSTMVECGFANIRNVEKINARAHGKTQGSLENKMESFVLSETLKYLYLLFDEDNFVNVEPHVFNTEAHPIPVRSVVEVLEKRGEVGKEDRGEWWKEMDQSRECLTMKEKSCDAKMNFRFLENVY